MIRMFTLRFCLFLLILQTEQNKNEMLGFLDIMRLNYKALREH